MAATLRLMRKGKKKKPFYHLVATDSRNPRDGAFIELLGNYNPQNNALEVKADRATHWLSVGAAKSATVDKLLRRAGIIGNKKDMAATQPQVG